MNKKAIKRLAVLVGIALLLGLIATWLAGWLLSHPVQTKVGSAPEDLGAETITLPSDSGASVAAWWCPTPNSRGTVLLLPGIRANRWSMVDRAAFLRRAGYSALLIDFQGTGETKGDHITFGWKESRDVLAAVDFIRKRQPTDHIAIIGSSLGGAAALYATPPLQVDRLILEAVYPTIEVATNNRIANWLGPLAPAITPLLLMQLHPRLGVAASSLHPIDYITKVTCPILIMSGEKDSDTSPDDTRLLFSNAPSPKELWLIPKAGHFDLHSYTTDEYESRVLAFFNKM